MQEKKQDYYVYIHRRLDTSVVFYVGSGRLNRAYQKQSRTKDWFSVVEVTDYSIEKIAENLEESQARELEEKYILNPEPSWQLVNKRLPTKVHELDYDFLSNYFYYDETSPSCLRYKNNVYKNKGALCKSAGAVAGNIQLRNGVPIRWRLHVVIDVKTTLIAHRIVWLLKNKELDSNLVIDHIDGNPLNNQINNLRQVSQQINARNKISKRVSEVGIVGITLKNNSYRAEITNGADRKGKSFSVAKYGKDRALYLAVKTRYDFLINQKEDMRFDPNKTNMDELLEIINNYERNNNNNKE